MIYGSVKLGASCKLALKLNTLYLVHLNFESKELFEFILLNLTLKKIMIKRLLYVAVAIVDVVLVLMGTYDWKMAGILFVAFIAVYFLVKKLLF